ncbi:MAG: pilus assembly protein N-terminal domain-containing protein [Alphaproteobacteria bacterium]
MMAPPAFAQKTPDAGAAVPTVPVMAKPAPRPAGNAPSFAPVNTEINDTPAPPAETVAPVQTSAGKGSVVDIITASPDDGSVDESVTHPPLKLTPDKSELVRLDGEAASVILGNPNHLSILADTSRTLILVPRAPGATYFTVLDNKGGVLMQRHVIVAAPHEKYVRIRRSCNGESGSNCQSTQVYYCPDMCHEIIMGGEMSQNASGQGAVSSDSDSDSENENSDAGDQTSESNGDDPEQPDTDTATEN